MYFALAHFSSKEIAEAASKYLKTFHMVKDSKAELFTKEECNFLGMNTKYCGEYMLIAPIWYMQFKTTTEQVSTGAKDFEAGWTALEKINQIKEEALKLEREKLAEAKAKKNAFHGDDLVKSTSRYNRDFGVVYRVLYVNNDMMKIVDIADPCGCSKSVYVSDFKKLSVKEMKQFSLK